MVLQSSIKKRFFSEENIWQLCKKMSGSQDELNRCYVVFISNDNKSVQVI